MLTSKELNEVKEFIKKVKKLKKEGSTTAGAPGYLTPKAFTGDEGGDGATDLKRITRATGYDKKVPVTRRHSVDLHEISYKEFKKDESRTTVKKVNESIIDINRKLREINSLISHSHKLKLESKLDDSVHWKKTNEALLKISNRMNEVAKKLREFANIKEIKLNDKIQTIFNDESLKTYLETQVYKTSNFYVDVEKSSDGYSVDYRVNEEPQHSFDVKGSTIYTSEGKPIGNLYKDQDIVEKLKGYFNK